MQASKMVWTFLGTGSAFTCGDGNWQSNCLVEVYERSHNAGGDNPTPARMLVDCGGDVRHALAEHDLTYADIDAVYISHLHSDHIGGMEGLMFSTYFNPKCPKPILFVHESLEEELWAALRPGVDCIEGVDVSLDTFFAVRTMGDDESFNFSRVDFDIVQTVHTMGNRKIKPSYGLQFEAPDGTKVFFTSDTQFSPKQIMHFFEKADLIFHDCETGFESGVHSHYSKMITLPDQIKKKMWLYHYQPGKLPDAEGEGFQGFIGKGTKFQWVAG